MEQPTRQRAWLNLLVAMTLATVSAVIFMRTYGTLKTATDGRVDAPAKPAANAAADGDPDAAGGSLPHSAPRYPVTVRVRGCGPIEISRLSGRVTAHCAEFWYESTHKANRTCVEHYLEHTFAHER